MVNSMTGFAALTGQTDDRSWTLEIKSVNARGLDIRQRIAEAGDVLEPLFKAELSKIAFRGSVNVFLRTEIKSNATAPRLNQTALDAAMVALGAVEQAADDKGVKLSPTTGADLLALRGVFEQSTVQTDASELVAAIKKAIPKIVKDFATSRASEGVALQQVLSEQIETVGVLTAQAVTAAGERRAYVAARLAENLDLGCRKPMASMGRGWNRNWRCWLLNQTSQKRLIALSPMWMRRVNCCRQRAPSGASSIS